MSLVQARTPTDQPTAPTRRNRRRRWATVGLVALVVGAAVAEWSFQSGWLTTAWNAITAASPPWATGALVATLASMCCFGMARRAALHAAAVPVSGARAIGASFAAGALHTTMPGGTVLAAAYAYRHMRTWGASASVAAWCLAFTGVIASATLTLFAIAGIAVGGSSSIAALAVEAAIASAVIAALVTVTRSPELLVRPATAVLRWINRCRSRPAETGLDSLLSTIDELATIRPTSRHWLACASWSSANWVLDAICLWAAATAVGAHVSLAGLVIAYTAGMLAGCISPLPGGAGTVETAMVISLTAAGMTAPAALAAVIIYRLISIGSTAAVGWVIIAGQGVCRLTSTATRPAPNEKRRPEGRRDLG